MNLNHWNINGTDESCDDCITELEHERERIQDTEDMIQASREILQNASLVVDSRQYPSPVLKLRNKSCTRKTESPQKEKSIQLFVTLKMRANTETSLKLVLNRQKSTKFFSVS